MSAKQATDNVLDGIAGQLGVGKRTKIPKTHLYGAPFSHLFTELKISLIEVHISAIELEISPIHLKISSNQLEISTIKPI